MYQFRHIWMRICRVVELFDKYRLYFIEQMIHQITIEDYCHSLARFKSFLIRSSCDNPPYLQMAFLQQDWALGQALNFWIASNFYAQHQLFISGYQMIEKRQLSLKVQKLLKYVDRRRLVFLAQFEWSVYILFPDYPIFFKCFYALLNNTGLVSQSSGEQIELDFILFLQPR